MAEMSIKGIIEALLFVNEEPLTIDQIKNLFDQADLDSVRTAIEELKNDYSKEDKGLRIVEVAGGFQMATNPNYVQFLKKFYSKRQEKKLSIPSLETLAIIAYKQPISRLEIESIRGVNVDGVMSSLLERGLIKIAGRKESLGRPFVYATTKQFLEYFGLKSLEDLPKIEDFSKLTKNISNDDVISEEGKENPDAAEKAIEPTQ